MKVRLIDLVEVAGESMAPTLRPGDLASTDSRSFGRLPASSIEWRAVARYWPPRRAGRLAPPGPLARPGEQALTD